MMKTGLGAGIDRSRCLWTNNRKPNRCVRFPTRSRPLSSEFATLGLTPLASKSDVKKAYKRLALKFHPDVVKGDNTDKKQQTFRNIKSAYESLMHKFELDEEQVKAALRHDEYDEWEEWMGFEGGMPANYTQS